MHNTRKTLITLTVAIRTQKRQTLQWPPKARKLRLLRRLWNLTLAVLVALSLTVHAEVKVAPTTIGPVTVEWSLDLSLPLLGR